VKYILVNGRSPFGRFACGACGKAIRDSYLREMSTQLYYCDPRCYSDHCNNAAVSLANRTRALVGLAHFSKNRSDEAELTVST
jgi:hypothetical protein